MQRYTDLQNERLETTAFRGKMAGAQLIGKSWSIPADAPLPNRKNARLHFSPLLKALKEQKDCKLKGSIYHRTQIDLTYNSNHIEGC